MAGARCTPPKAQRVKEHWRAKPRKKRRLFGSGQTFYVAENERGDTCGHQHKTRSAAMTCARKANLRESRRGRRKDASYLSEKRTAK